MKRIYLLGALCMLTSISFAQKKAVKEAKSAMGSKNFDEARALIKPALTDPETGNSPDTWKLAGDIEFRVYDTERTNEMTKELNNGKGADELKMYTGLFNMYAPYMVADSLAQLPDEKGKVKNKVRKDITDNIKQSHSLYINGGLYYNGKNEYAKASEYFERYWNIPSLPIFDGDNTFIKDSTFQTIKYYAAITAIQSENHPRAIALLKRMASEPYVLNSAYKESDVYELLVSEYTQTGDSVNSLETLRVGATKFPGSKFFIPNLINNYITSGKNDEAIRALDQAIVNDPSNNCELYSLKAALMVQDVKYAEGEAIYNQALQNDPNCEKALEGLAVVYILKAQEMKEQVSKTNIRKEQAELDKQTIEFYTKSLPYLEKYRDLVKARKAETKDVRNALTKLQHVYYNLTVIGVNKDAELKVVEAELEAL